VALIGVRLEIARTIPIRGPHREGHCTMFAKGRIDLVVIYGFATGVRSVASPQKWGRQSYRMDFTPSKIIAIKRALEPSARKCQLLHEKEPQHTVISANIF
jgi:hypothetical protein